MADTLTPEEFAEVIVDDLLGDLPIEIKDAVRFAIIGYANQWADLVESVSKSADDIQDCP